MKHLILILSMLVAVTAGAYTKEEQKILNQVTGSVMSSMKKYVKKFDKGERSTKLLLTATAYLEMEACKKSKCYDNNLKMLVKYLKKNNKSKGNYYCINRDFQDNFKIYEKLDKEIETYKGDKPKYRKLQKCRDYFWLYSLYPLKNSTKCAISKVAENVYRNVNGYMARSEFRDNKVRFTDKYRGPKKR